MGENVIMKPMILYDKKEPCWIGILLHPAGRTQACMLAPCSYDE
jgi:hypothetical protein